MASTRNSLVMGVAAGYTLEKVLPFLNSLRSTSYKGKVSLFVKDMEAEDLVRLRTYVDDVVLIDDLFPQDLGPSHHAAYARFIKRIRLSYRLRRFYPFLFHLRLQMTNKAGKESLQLQLEQFLEGQMALRHFYYLRYLENQGMDADYVMLSDVRDVVFQGDPFERIDDDVLQVFLEAEHVKIGSEQFNRGWIRNLYGEKVVASISDAVVSCAGTTMGSRSQIVRYLAQMTAEIIRHPCPLGSHDQGIHNYLLRTGKLDPVTILGNGEGAVMTLGLERDIRQDSRGRVLDKQGGVSPILHQYDRHPDLTDTLLKQHH